MKREKNESETNVEREEESNQLKDESKSQPKIEIEWCPHPNSDTAF